MKILFEPFSFKKKYYPKGDGLMPSPFSLSDLQLCGILAAKRLSYGISAPIPNFNVS